MRAKGFIKTSAYRIAGHTGTYGELFKVLYRTIRPKTRAAGHFAPVFEKMYRFCGFFTDFFKKGIAIEKKLLYSNEP